MYAAEISVSDAAAILACDPSTVRKFIAAGALRVRDAAPPESIRRRWRVLRDDVEALRNGHAVCEREARKRRGFNRRAYQPTLLK